MKVFWLFWGSWVLVIMLVLGHNMRAYMASDAYRLQQLEFAILRLPSYESEVETPTDNTFYWSAFRIQRILERQMGATVVYGSPIILGAAGVTEPNRAITIEQSLMWTARFETLAHEAAHLIQPSLSTRMDGEVFAESVAYLVATHDGDKDALWRSAKYLSGGKASIGIIRLYQGEIIRAARFLE